MHSFHHTAVCQGPMSCYDLDRHHLGKLEQSASFSYNNSEFDTPTVNSVKPHPRRNSMARLLLLLLAFQPTEITTANSTHALEKYWRLHSLTLGPLDLVCKVAEASVRVSGTDDLAKSME